MLGTSMSDALVQLHQCTGLAAACDVLVNSMKQCSGFSRVMVYKFHRYCALLLLIVGGEVYGLRQGFALSNVYSMYIKRCLYHLPVTIRAR